MNMEKKLDELLEAQGQAARAWLRYREEEPGSRRDYLLRKYEKLRKQRDDLRTDFLSELGS